MKNIRNFAIIFLMISFTTACRKEEANKELSDTLQEGRWKITEFFHIDHYETKPYLEYKVTFTVENTVTASGTNFLVGKWIISRDGKLSLDFGKSFLFEKFNATWDVVSYDSQQIKLDLYTPAYNATDHLTLEKIQ
jgi:hypothetical protein